MNAFCACPFRVFSSPHRVAGIGIVASTYRITPYAKASKSSRNKRPRAERRGPAFSSQSSSQTPKRSSRDEDFDGSNDDTDTDDANESSRARELSKADANGISLEHRLREEILHPLRKPKQTLFATLTFSATLGLFFACARLIAEKDGLARVSTNVAIDAAAVTLFGYLTWRELEFGRRSLNSIAGRPQPRDLPIVKRTASSRPRIRLPFRRDHVDAQRTERLSTLLRVSDTIIVTGRLNDVEKYLDRCAADAAYTSNAALSDYGPAHPVVVACITDVRDSSTIENQISAATAFAAPGPDSSADWVAWLGDAVPPRRNVALFRISGQENATNAANAYIVTIGDPISVPLPADAKKLTIVEV